MFRILQLAFLILLVVVAVACRASAPGKVETALMTRAKRLLFVGNKDARNPLQANPQTIESGKEAFSSYCMVCHGLDGQNTGVPFADRMSPPVPNLTSKEVQSYTDGQLKWIIENGLSPSGMPASKGILNDDEIWSIVAYIRNLPKPGSLGEPCIYTGECSQPEPGQVQPQKAGAQ
ncbi:MAG TPA: cytochrome c [Terriglobales bacterium]|nr:cytochrome c [Terriglobales bacterium]